MATDRLQSVLNACRAWCEARSVPFAYAYLSRAGGLPRVRFNVESPNAGAEYRALLERTRARLVACVETRLDPETFAERIAELREHDAPAEVLQEAESCASHLGHVAALELRAICTDPPAVITYQDFAPWFALFYTDAFDPKPERQGTPDAAVWEEREKERALWTRQRRSECARLLATDERFASCKTEAARVHLLGIVLDGALPADDYMAKEITREARAIYDLEVKQKRRD